MNEAQRVAQAVADLFYRIGTSDDPTVSGGPTYAVARKLLKVAVRAAYPHLSVLKANRVFDVFIDCQESIEYCVWYVRTTPTSSAYTK